MVKENTKELYDRFLKNGDRRWMFGNIVLYSMCAENPTHNNADTIVGKVWLIGRSYAAAIERRKNAIESNDDFYYNKVAPIMLEKGRELDEKLSKLKNSNGSIIDDLEDILGTHSFLMKIFVEITHLNKRSLASKYLHFHCPSKFFIFDSRANSAISKMVVKPNKKMLEGKDSYDKEYANFVCKMIELQNYINEENEEKERKLCPRQLDDFLLMV